ncbi:UvrABC system protein A [termite gut metagenome]|uniref:UvrABC system protein A n=1 Tax=termite gut metagenome TaxID=433724 RepID=A0A5J4T1R6_9ZZZZ
MPETEYINVYGARMHNLKNIDAEIPRNSLTVITGLSGSGKSSLAFDTIFAEGQRRYIETFSAYARNFLGNLERPDVDKITGLSPVISIEQKTTNRNPRSTVGTTTEIYDYLRLLFARAGEAYSYLSGEKMVKHTEEQVLELIVKNYTKKRIYILSPLVRTRKGHYRELFEQVRKRGYLYVRVDGEICEITSGMKLDRYKNHDIEIVIDKMTVSEKDYTRLKQSVATAMRLGDGLLMILDAQTFVLRHYSKRLMDPVTGLSYEEPAPHNFSFNSPQGACPRCKGLGIVSQMDIEKLIPDKKPSIYNGAIVPLGKYKNTMIFWQIAAILDTYEVTLNTPVKDIPDEAIDEILYGSDGRIKIKNTLMGTSSDYFVTYEGVVKYIQMLQEKEASATEQKWAEQFVKTVVCSECKGMRLNKEALHFRIGNKNINELSDMEISELYNWLMQVDDLMSETQKKIAAEILKEIRTRLKFLLDVGLDYLSLNRSSVSLSGGESQRIRLATQIGSQLVNVLYILDEPSIGLHQRDNLRLIHSLRELRDIGNSVIVVEHDKEMMIAADYVIDMGPKAGRLGGEVVFEGKPKKMLQVDTLTSQYLSGKKKIEVPAERRKGNGKSIWIRGAKGNNLKNVDVEFPLGKMICVTGVSGSGKSTLINETLQPILSQKFYRSLQDPLEYDSVEGMEYIDKVVNVDQSPLGKTPRSNPATYTGVFSDIRNLYVGLPEAKIRGYKPGRFSFNVIGGRCEVCSGNGYKTIEMNFLPDVYVPCEVCHGKRYNRETLEVRFKGKSIADVLDMTIHQAVAFFENVPQILNKIKTIQEVGLGYIKLGQSSTTLSGGESQRVKLAAELSKRDTGKTLYILDEPTTGLHFEDIRVLLGVLDKLTNKGNTVIVIEHNLDVIKMADYMIDMGPEGGKEGGEILSFGTPEEVARSEKGYTPKFLREEL